MPGRQPDLTRAIFAEGWMPGLIRVGGNLALKPSGIRLPVLARLRTGN